MNRRIIQLILSIILLILSNAQNASAQPLYPDLKSAVIIQFANNITWENEKEIKLFRIGVLGDDSETYNALLTAAKKNTIRNKAIEITALNRISDIQDIQLLFVSKSELTNINQIYLEIEKKKILLITEECQELQYVMLNILYNTDSELVSFEINKANLVIENFTINPELLLLGGTEVDVRQIYHQMQKQLSEETKMVLEYQDLINIQESQLNSQANKISEQTRTTDSLLFFIENLEKQINSKEADLTALNLKSKNQENILQTKSGQMAQQDIELQQQREKITEWEDKIESKTKVLDDLLLEIEKQIDIIDEQEKILSSKENLILTQRKLVYAVIGFSIVLMLLGLSLFNAYRTKKRVNQTLEERVIKRTKELEEEIEAHEKSEQELIIAKDKAEESDRLKSAFLSNMSHEIRTPMNGILGFTKLLQRADISVENQQKFIEIIRKSSARLFNTVNDIIEISKIESGEVKESVGEVNLLDHLETLVTFFTPEIKKKGLSISSENEISGHDIIIQTDKTKLSSILSNLIKNSIKYTNEGFIKVGFKLNEGQLIFYCKDSGIGIPKNRQEAIFNRFEQADIEDKQAHQGSGLGLAIVKSYLEILGGKIWLESELGKGSTFYVALPYNPVKSKQDDLSLKEKSYTINNKNINVLIVEDDEISSIHLSILLSGFVQNVTIVQNGIEAVDACKNETDINLVLMDIKMPKMDGFEATRRIREFNKKVIIIAQTAYAFKEDKQKALAAGCNAYISKPIKEDMLLEMINKYF